MIIFNKKRIFFQSNDKWDCNCCLKVERLYVYMKIVQCDQLIIYVRNKYKQVKEKNIKIKIIMYNVYIKLNVLLVNMY